MDTAGLKIITFNVWDLPLWFVPNRKERIRGIAEYIKKENADIICLQEIWSNKNRRLIIELLEGNYHAFSFGIPPKKGFFSFLPNANGGLLTLSKFPILSQNFIPFTRLNHSLTELISNKGMLESVISAPWGTFRLINLHLHRPDTFLSKWMRLRQLKSVMKFVEKNPSTPTIMAGDFNQHALLEQTDFRDLLYTNGFTHPAPDTESPFKPTYRIENPFVQAWINRRKNSQRFDYIFIKSLELLQLHVYEYAPVYLPTPLSDHDPLFLHLTKSKDI